MKLSLPEDFGFRLTYVLGAQIALWVEHKICLWKMTGSDLDLGDMIAQWIEQKTSNWKITSSDFDLENLNFRLLLIWLQLHNAANVFKTRH